MRVSLFQLSSNECYNSRAISTLAVESFFSDLSQFEFGGLGAPKAVDIPKLISHVVYINTTKHDPEHRFEFVTMTRDNYLVYLMEQNNDYIPGTMLKNHSFDSQKNRKKYKSKKWFHLSKLKQVAKGGVGICQYYKVDETKLSAEQRFGRNLNIEENITL